MCEAREFVLFRIYYFVSKGYTHQNYSQVCLLIRVIARVGKVFEINSTSNAIEIVQGEAESVLSHRHPYSLSSAGRQPLLNLTG